MSPCAQNIAIAQSLGLTIRMGRHRTPYVGRNGKELLPDYQGDLNACHQFEMKLSKAEHQLFCARLRKFCGEDDAISAPADLRAQAYLQLKQLWK